MMAVPEPVSPREPPVHHGRPAFLRNLHGGLATAFLRPLPRGGLVATWGQLALFIVLSLVSTLVWQRVAASGAVQFSPGALPDAALPITLLLVGCAALAALAGRTGATLGLVVTMLAASLWLDAIVTLLVLVGDRVLPLRGALAWLRYGLYYAGVAWFAAAFAVAASRLLPLSSAGRVVALVVGAGVVALPFVEGVGGRQFWVSAPDPAALARQQSWAAAAGESLLYSQPDLLARELRGLLPRRPGRPNLYLVSVAGYAEQDVFMREVMAVDALFAERFGTRGRSVRLVNNRATLRDIPLATRTSLADSLRKVGATMDRDEDILFLFMTSHGLPGRFSLSFYPLSFADLTPSELRRMLDDAGIRHRVLVISACYSGSFVEALRDDDTLVITASAPDRNSFGCSNEADFTYFGRAYFDEALRRHGSFVEAFDAALPVIAGREKAQDYEPSAPQRAVGARIGARLGAWQAALEAERGAGAVPAR